MSSTTISVNGIGLSSAIGGYKDAMAAFRAGLNRFAAHETEMTMGPGEEEPSPLTVSPVAANGFVYQGVGRLVKMVQWACLDLKDNIRAELPLENTVMLFATPDPDERAIEMEVTSDTSREQRLQMYLDTITEPLFRLLPELSRFPMQAVFGDRVAFARVFKKASEILSSGKAQHCLLVTVDSLLSQEYLDEQIATDMLKTEQVPAGYIAGEGASVILLSAQPANFESRVGWSPVSFVTSTSLDTRVVSQDIPTDIDADDEKYEQQLQDVRLKSWQGASMLKLIHSVIAPGPELQTFPLWYSDINGDELRAVECGQVMVKLRANYPNAAHSELQIPALSFGEVGALSGALAFSAIIFSVQRNYCRAAQHLVTLSEDSGRRAVIFINLASH